jgi:hypothetical protein
MKLHDYTGVIHFHSAFSFDGHVEMAKIIEAAGKNKIDFLLLTDHDHLQARDEGWEGWQGKTLLIVGQEISPRFNHYLAFNIPRPVHCPEDSENVYPQQYIDAVNDQGGFGFIAHPDHEGTKTFHVKHYPWIDWSVQSFSGMSIWDFMTDWQNSLKGFFPSLLSFFFPVFFLNGPLPVTLGRWDSLSQSRKIVGIGELDNHATVKKVGGFHIEVFPFDRAFKFIRTHVLSKEKLCGNNKQDINLILDSLHYGRCYVALEYFQESLGFDFNIEQDSQKFFMGDTLTLSDKTILHISLPVPALVRILRNGSLVTNEKNKTIILPVIEPGVYRIEAFLKVYGKYRPWIFSNPIFVFQAD